MTQGQLDPSKGGSSKDDGPAEKKTVKQEFGDPSKSEFVKDIFSSNVESEDSAAFPDEALQIEKGKEQQQSKLKKNDEFHGPPATTETTIASTTTDLLGHLDVSTNTRSSFSENTSPESDPFQPTTEGTAELTPEKLATTEKPIAAENTSSNKPTTESEHKEEHRAGVSDVSSPDAKQLDETTITPPSKH